MSEHARADPSPVGLLDPGPTPPHQALPTPTEPTSQRAPASASVPGRRRRGPRGPRGPGGIQPRPGHIYGLDGLRGIAIIAVLVYHFSPSLLPGGFLGVDVFFVVSGFLISTLLMRELHDRGRIDLPAFWLRRARRLVPALVVVVVLSVAVARLIGGDLLVAIRRQSLGALTFSTNWLEIAAGSSYFSATSPLLFVNFWSLAVEEQFYLLWPFALVVIIAMTASTRSRVLVAGALTLSSVLAMAWLFEPGTDGSRVYYGTDTHAFSLMAGVALAFAWVGQERAWLHTLWWRRWRGAAVTGALLTLIGLMMTLDELSSWTFRGGIALAALATVVLIAGLLEIGSPWRAMMHLRPLVWLGRRCYGIYLWHWPVLVMALAVFPVAPGTLASAVVLTGALLTTLVLSALSFTAVEMPIRRHGFIAPLLSAAVWLATPWQTARAPRVIAGCLAFILLLMIAAVVTAPEKSTTQRQIESAERVLEQDRAPNRGAAQAGPVRSGETISRATGSIGAAVAAAASQDQPDSPPPSSANWGYTKDEQGLLVPKGKDITAIGDSLVVTSADGLRYRFPGMTFVAKSNRQLNGADTVLEDALDEGLIRDNVVLHLGTNAGVDEGRLRDLLDTLGPDRRVVVMNLFLRASFTEESNEIIDKVAADYPLVTVGDWSAAASAHPDSLQSDAIHPDIDGMRVYAEVVARSFDALARSRS